MTDSVMAVGEPWSLSSMPERASGRNSAPLFISPEKLGLLTNLGAYIVCSAAGDTPECEVGVVGEGICVRVKLYLP